MDFIDSLKLQWTAGTTAPPSSVAIPPKPSRVVNSSSSLSHNLWKREQSVTNPDYSDGGVVTMVVVVVDGGAGTDWTVLDSL